MVTHRPVSSSETASIRMRAVRGRDTRPEMLLRSLLHRSGWRYQIDARPIRELNRRADIVFRSRKLAVFVDGCFWHGCPLHATQSKANRKFWRDKIRNNVRRDRDTDAKLVNAGWRVVRIWEHVDPQYAFELVVTELNKRNPR